MNWQFRKFELHSRQERLTTTTSMARRRLWTRYARRRARLSSPRAPWSSPPPLPTLSSGSSPSSTRSGPVSTRSSSHRRSAYIKSATKIDQVLYAAAVFVLLPGAGGYHHEVHEGLLHLFGDVQLPQGYHERVGEVWELVRSSLHREALPIVVTGELGSVIECPPSSHWGTPWPFWPPSSNLGPPWCPYETIIEGRNSRHGSPRSVIVPVGSIFLAHFHQSGSPYQKVP